MADEQICPGPCNNPYRRVQAEYKAALAAYDPLDPAQSRPEPPTMRAWRGDPWCARCKSVIRIQLGELDDLAALRMASGDGYPAGSTGSEIRGNGDHPSPGPAADDTEDAYRMLTGWEDAYRELQRWPSPPRRGILAGRRTTCIAWLAEHLDAILVSPLGADFGSEVMQWHRQLKSATKAGQRTLRKPLRCPSCLLLLLSWDEGDKYVQCTGCGLLMTYDEYEAEVARIAAGIERGDSIQIVVPGDAVLLA